MTKFSTGAFAFTITPGLRPQNPESLVAIAERHGYPTSIIPEYAGDRAAVGRAIQKTSAGLYKEGFLLRPIKRNAEEVVYGIVSETKDEQSEKVDHEHLATVTWKSEPDAGAIQGDHPIAQRIAGTYQNLRGMIVSEDWSSTIVQFLETNHAAKVREDGRVYFVPPQKLETVKKFSEFLAEVGIDLVLAEIEPEVATVVKGVANDSIAEQLERLQAEVEQFDGKQKPSTYARRLEEYKRLRERATLYQEALGVGVGKTRSVLAELEQKVQAMFELRKNTTISRNGTVVSKEKTSAPKRKAELTSTGLVFGGAKFKPAESGRGGDVLYTSSSKTAQNVIATLEKVGVAGKWQTAGKAEVMIGNSGPEGAETSIRIRVPENTAVESFSKQLATLGIEFQA